MSANNNFNNQGNAPTTAGPHDSDVLNKLDPRVDSDNSKLQHNTASGTHAPLAGAHGSTHPHGVHSEGATGPHNSRAANALDPRVDSDRDGSHTAGTYGTTGLGSTHSTHGTTGLGNTHGTHSEGATGPHNSRVANALDPRVDSDRDGSHTAGTYGSTGLGNTHGTHGTTGLGSTHGTHSEGAHGPHSSRLANAADPRVDSDRDGSHTAGTHVTTGLGSTHGNTGLGSTHGTHSEGAHGPHSSRLANAADPRVDSDRDGSRTAGTHGAGTHGTTGLGNTTHTHGADHGLAGTAAAGTHDKSHLPGPATETAGPHKSNLLNKLDPRVDSDLDGSKTIGKPVLE